MARRGGFGNRPTNLPQNFGSFDQSIGPLLQPPPLFPPNDKKPAETECGVDMEYLLLMDRVFIDHFSDLTSDIFEQDDKMEHIWDNMPHELRPRVKTKLVVVKTNIVNADQELDRLERLEKKLNNDKDEEDLAEHQEEVDEEMDDGTDYNIDYFDNGEMYEENDDGDGGPVY